MAALSTLDLSRRVRAILEGRGINDTATLVALNERELFALPGIGLKALREVKAALDAVELTLAVDEYAPYVCARHGAPALDANLANLFLCDDCATVWQKDAFGDHEAEYVGAAPEGFCLNCNLWRPDIRLRQWFLCGTCERVARSIGRSVVAERFVARGWQELVAPYAPGLVLRGTDVPMLRRRGRDASATKRAEIDFVARDVTRSEDLFGFELKTGKSYISGAAQVGAQMGQFQLDTSDCDDITTVIERDGIPVYVLHVQVIDRAFPPTVQYAALAGWWTDVFRMHDNFRHVQMRSREARTAAYFNAAMFESFPTFAEHIRNGDYERLAARLRKEGPPTLYVR
jgi:hypothetical protein